jgi:hypothetical protein
MANTRSANVIIVDTSAAYPDVKNVRSIKYIGATTSTASIKSGASSSGTVLWEESASTNVMNSNVEIRDPEGIYVTITGTAKVYLYLK